MNHSLFKWWYDMSKMWHNKDRQAIIALEMNYSSQSSVQLIGWFWINVTCHSLLVKRRMRNDLFEIELSATIKKTERNKSNRRDQREWSQKIGNLFIRIPVKFSSDFEKIVFDGRSVGYFKEIKSLVKQFRLIIWMNFIECRAIESW